MSIIELIFLLVLIGVGLWLLNEFVPMNRPIKTIINVVIILLVIMWVLESFGLFQSGIIRPIRFRH